VLLLRNLMRQSEGREADIPALALQALQEAGEPLAAVWPALSQRQQQCLLSTQPTRNLYSAAAKAFMQQ
jgi:hypothetical protein